MFYKIMKNMAMVNILIGISGVTGAIARDTGLIQSLVLLIAGAAIMSHTYKMEKGGRKNGEAEG